MEGSLSAEIPPAVDRRPAGSSARRKRAVALFRGLVRYSPLARRLIWSVPASSQAVALTFDDGPNPDWTPRVLDILASHHATASFFLLGGKASEHPELVSRLAAEGHSVGSHTTSHRHLRALSPRETRRDIASGQAAVAAVLGQPTRWFRPPYGSFSPASLWETARRGVTTVLWSVDPRDYESANAEEILARLGPLRAGDVVLLHDRGRATVEALPEILARIADAGLRAASLDVAMNGGRRD